MSPMFNSRRSLLPSHSWSLRHWALCAVSNSPRFARQSPPCRNGSLSRCAYRGGWRQDAARHDEGSDAPALAPTGCRPGPAPEQNIADLCPTAQGAEPGMVVKGARTGRYYPGKRSNRESQHSPREGGPTIVRALFGRKRWPKRRSTSVCPPRRR
jgi:hypothetical protein